MPAPTTSPSNETRERPALTPRRALVEATHLFALWGFAVAQPLFQVLATDANFFVVRGSRPADVVAHARATPADITSRPTFSMVSMRAKTSNALCIDSMAQVAKIGSWS